MKTPTPILTRNTDLRPIDLRRANGTAGFIGGAANHLKLSIGGEIYEYWYAIGDAAQAIKRIEQALMDEDRRTALWCAMQYNGWLAIADSVQEACRLLQDGRSYNCFPDVVFAMHGDGREAFGRWLNEDLGQIGTTGR